MTKQGIIKALALVPDVVVENAYAITFYNWGPSFQIYYTDAVAMMGGFTFNDNGHATASMPFGKVVMTGR